MNWPIIIIFLIAWIIIGTAAIAGWSAAPWVPSRKNQQKLLLKHVVISQGSTVYDLGCGTGTLLFSASKNQPNAKYIGFEISLLPYLFAKIKAHFFKNVDIKFGNLFRQNLADADVIFVFLLDKAYPRLEKKFSAELKDDCIVAFEAWPIKNIESFKKIREEKVLPIYLYKGSQFKK